MKQSILRILCAFLLMGMALAVTAGIFAASKEEETVYTWQTVKFAATQEVRLFSKDGELLQTLAAENGIAVSRLLPDGRYYAFSGEVCVEFVLHSDCSVSVEGGCGWTDGKVLHLTDEPVGTVRVEFPAEEEFYSFTLIGGENSRRETVRGVAGQTVCCEFLGVPYGTYILYQGEEAVAHVSVSDETPIVSIALS